MVGKAQRLGALQMGVPGNQRVAVLIGLTEEGGLQPFQIPIEFVQTTAQPEP